jgi:beta-lactamase regulating signal transducer with metallopeptidase domain
MDTLFTNILNMSISASYLIIAVIVIRLLLGKAPKNMRCYLWLLVGIRLIFPFSIESMFSLIPSTQVINETVYYNDEAPMHGYSLIQGGNISQPILQTNKTPELATVKTLSITDILPIIWIAGVVLMLGYVLFSWIKIKRKIADSVPTIITANDNSTTKIYQSDRIDTPFLFGLIKPRIYVPFGISENDLPYVIMHEKAHIRRRDYLIKPIGFLILSVYWFNPLVWLAYILLCKDIELACEEKVVNMLGMDLDFKKSYSQALLTCAVNRRMIAACPLAFGEVGVKTRVKNILNYKKPTFWIILVAIIACIAVPICFMTSKKDNISEDNNTSILTNSETNTEADTYNDIYGVYILVNETDNSADSFTPTLTLTSPDTFSFSYDSLNSYNPTGTYEINGDTLQAYTSDGFFTYEFTILDDGTLKYNGDTLTNGQSEDLLKYENVITKPTFSENAIFEKAPAEEHTEYEWVEIWATAFCERDADKLASMVGESAVKDLEESIDFEYITLDNGEKSATFGWSSPWPWGEYPYDINTVENGQAEITYYAITSDPHIWIWNETLTYELTDDGFKVTSENLTMYDNISSIDEYNKAYPDGIGHTMMDYTNNGLGFDEILNNNALANKSVYSDLFAPDTAAIYILNLNKDAVTISIEPDEYGFSGSCYAIIIFKNDTSSASVKLTMTRQDETSGIWLPYTVPARYSNYIESDNASIGQIGEDGYYYSKSDISEDETEVVASETTADLNHDGINDLIQLVVVTYKNTANDIKKILDNNISLSYVKVYRGISSNTYEEQAYFVSRDFCLAHVGNGFNCLTYVDGEAYFIIGSFWEGQGSASYGYNVFYLDDEQGAVVVQSDSVEFIAWEEDWGDSWNENLHRADVIPDFEEKLSPWLENAEIIICQDIDEGSFSNITGKCPASNYFDIIWGRTY